MRHPRGAPQEVKRALEEEGFASDRKELVITCHDDCGFVNALLGSLGFSETEHQSSHDQSIPVLIKATAPMLRKALGENWKLLPTMNHESRRRLAEEKLAECSAEHALGYPVIRKALETGNLDEVGVY